MNWITILILSLVGFSGCCKDPIPPNPPCAEPCDTAMVSNLEIVWQVPLRPDTSEGASRFPIVDGDQIIFSHQFASGGEQFYALDALTGQQRWHWSDNKTGSITSQQYGLHSTGTHLIASMGSSYFIDRGTGNTNWWIYIDGLYCASVQSTIIGNYFYQNLGICQAAYDTVALVRRTPLNVEMTWDTLFITRPAQNDGYYSNFQPAALWIHPSGDSILIMKNRMITAFFPLIDRADLWAWNLSADTLLWRVEDFSKTGHTRIGPPTIYQDRAYLYSGGSEIHCYDLNNGQAIWIQHIPQVSGGFNTAQPLIADGVLFVKSTDWNAYGLNPETGSIMWQRVGDVGTCESLLAYHDGKVYYTGFDLHPGELYALDIHTGKTVWAEPSPAKKKYPDASFVYNGVAIDPVRKVLYTSDSYYAYCIKLPK